MMDTTMDNTRNRLIADAYSRLGGAVYGYILKRTGSPSDAEDILQDVFLNLLQSDAVVSEYNVSRFIYRLARSRVIDWLRRHALSEKAAEYFASVSCLSAGVTDEHVAAAEVRRLESGCLSAMPSRRAEVYLLYVHRGCSVKDISEMLELSRRTVENHLFNARALLKAEFRKSFSVPGTMTG